MSTHIHEDKFHWDASDYEGVNVRVMVRNSDPTDVSVIVVFVYKGDIEPVSMTEEAFVAIFPDGQDICNRAMEYAARGDS